MPENLCADWEVSVELWDDLKVHRCCLFALVSTANKAAGRVKHGRLTTVSELCRYVLLFCLTQPWLRPLRQLG